MSIRLPLVLLAAIATGAVAQCPGLWDTSHAVAGVNGDVLASVRWDPDADGPLPSLLIVAGDFNAAGTSTVANIAAWDPDSGQWSPVGEELSAGPVRALAVTSNGELIAAADLAQNPSGAARVVKWDGMAWIPLGVPFDAPVRSLLALSDGGIIAAGDFGSTHQAAAACIASWDGSAWHTLGQGVQSLSSDSPASIRTLLRIDDSRFVAGGTFSRAGGIPCNQVALWDGQSWSPLGTGIPGGPNASVRASALLPSGECVIGGWFTQAGGVPARNAAAYSFETRTWRSLGLQTPEIVDALLTLDDGRLVAGCRFWDPYRIRAAAIWDGTSWTPLDYGLDCTVTTLCKIDGNRLLVGGYARDGQGVAQGTTTVAVWETTEEGLGRWRAAGEGLSAAATTMLALPSGDLVCGGEFLVNAVEGPTYGLARFEASSQSWHSMGDRPDFPVHAITRLPDGSLIVGGEFRHIGGIAAPAVAQWDTRGWTPLGSGLDGVVLTLASRALAGGQFEVIAGGQFRVPANIARYTSTSGGWAPMGPGFDSKVNAVSMDPTGVIYAAGDFLTSGTRLMRGFAIWGIGATTWASVDSGLNGRVNAIVALPGGGFVVGGEFTHVGVGGVSRNLSQLVGGRWMPLGTGTNGPVRALAPGFGNETDVLVGGSFTQLNGATAPGIGRIAAGLAIPLGDGVDGEVRSIAVAPDSTVFLGGEFARSDGRASGYIGAWRPSGPLPRFVVQPQGASLCPGSTALLQIEVEASARATFQWTRNGLPLLAADEGEAVISGATTRTLQFTGATARECNGIYACIVTDLCGQARSQEATVLVGEVPACIADFNSDGGVDGADIESFFTAFAAGGCAADVSGDGGVDGADIESFIGAWERGDCIP